MLMILTFTINIGKIFELTLGQGHKVKGQGQIRAYVMKLENFMKNQRISTFGCHLQI